MMHDGETTAAPLAEPTREEEADESLLLNRELQWLEFNDRVLHQALDERMPLLERVQFLSIFSSNLDEFFMKRVGGLRRQIAMGIDVVGYEKVSPESVLLAIRERVIPMIEKKASCYRDDIVPALREIGVELLDDADLSEAERREVRRWYRHDVFPILTPLAVDPGHRFPFISNLSVSLGLMLRRPNEPEALFARVKIPEIVPQWYRLEGTMRFVPLDQIIRHNLQDLFPGMEIVEVMPFRVTRNADVEGDHEDAEDLLAQIQQQLHDRRFAPVVRMQTGKNPSRRLLNLLCEETGIEERDIYETAGLINYRTLDEIASLPLPAHHFTPWTPVTPPRLRERERDIFSIIREGDVLVHHPYESFDNSVERFIEEAAADDNVVAIKQALYRTSGDSPFIPELIRAAESGKQVAVLVELRARFDEARNIHWARKLEDAGVHVAYGVVGFKTHTKITLVVRREADGLRCYAHVGTGNYHSRTARIYEDIGLLTGDPLITEDCVNLFNYITGRSTHDRFNKLLVAPQNMKQRFLELIEREMELHSADHPGRIVAKMNQLQDRAVIGALYRASRAGVKIDLIVRGFCTLRPGATGLSENIRVMSIIGRFLEHSRIYYFRNGREDPLEGDFLIGSADWMHRNLHNRVEAICPIEHREHRARLWRILNICLEDHRQCWDMQPDGSYVPRRCEGADANSPAAMGTHETLMSLARETARQAASEDR
jgi:polyphosphate kinase